MDLDKAYFEKNQRFLLRIANSRWASWILGIDQIPEKHRQYGKFFKITPEAIHYHLNDGQKRAIIFIGPHFADSLRYVLSPTAYLRRSSFTKRFRFSPVGALWLLSLFFTRSFLWLAVVDTIYLASGLKNGTRTQVLLNDFVSNSENAFTIGGYRIWVLTEWRTTLESFVLTYDTSSLGAGASVTDADIHLTKTTGLTSSTRTWELLTEQNAVTGDVDAVSDFTAFDTGSNQIWAGTLADSPEDVDFDNSYVDVDGNTDFKGNRTGNWSLNNGEIARRQYFAYDWGSTYNYLTITYTPGAGTVIKDVIGGGVVPYKR